MLEMFNFREHDKAKVDQEKNKYSRTNYKKLIRPFSP